MKPAQIASFIPSRRIICPARGGVESYKTLEPGIEYIVIDTSAEVLRISDRYAFVEYLPDKPLHQNVKDMALLFPGGIGDALALKACIELIDKEPRLFPHLHTIAIFSTKDDMPIFCDGVIKRLEITVMNYPPFRDVVDKYDAIVGFGTIERESVARELSDTFADIIGIPAPSKSAGLKSRGKYRKLFAKILDSGKPRIGLQVYSNAHSRSIPPHNAVIMGILLAEQGFDVYLIGTNDQRMNFIEEKDGVKINCGPPPGIHDFSGYCNGIDELIAFADMMDGIICPDTSLLHIGGCLKKPTVALFGPTSGGKRTTYYPTVKTLTTEMECSPCLQIRSAPNCEGPWCKAIWGVMPDTAVKTLLELMNYEAQSAR